AEGTQLYASLLLQVFFFAANIYGWYAWSRQTSQNEAELKIRWLPLPKALSCMPACYYRCFSLPRIFTVGMRGRDKPVRTRRS
ncbi:nicotinamide mononucleotide transporter, partial [Escherichia coli]|nr:nicotinamide mononucleotide transporter [Escherichia coli]